MTLPPSVTVPVRHRGLRVAYIFAGSIGAWMAHLFFASSFVRFSCTTHGTTGYQYLVTVICAALAGHATWVAYGLHREGQSDAEDAGTSLGANNFIGLAGVIVGLTSVLLILAEGSFVGLIHPGCR